MQRSSGVKITVWNLLIGIQVHLTNVLVLFFYLFHDLTVLFFQTYLSTVTQALVTMSSSVSILVSSVYRIRSYWYDVSVCLQKGKDTYTYTCVCVYIKRTRNFCTTVHTVVQLEQEPDAYCESKQNKVHQRRGKMSFVQCLGGRHRIISQDVFGSAHKRFRSGFYQKHFSAESKPLCEIVWPIIFSFKH